MNYVGIDLHKTTISVCCINGKREVLGRRRFFCKDTARIEEYFRGLGEFQMVVEATASYEWLFRLIEPLAQKAVLAHPKKLRVIAESTRKSDRLDAQLLAEFLALDMIPTSYRPTPRQREHRRLVRQRDGVQRRITSAKNRIRRVLSDYNADIPHLFTQKGMAYLHKLALSDADRFAVDQMVSEYEFLTDQLRACDRRIDEFAATAPAAETEARALLRSIPGVGRVTTETVLSELADVSRFRSQKQVVAYAGLAPGQRESNGKKQELHIEKNGSKRLRWVLVEAAWQLVRRTARWREVYRRLKLRLKPKKAIVAIARRLLCLMTAILKSGQPYHHALDAVT
jgi:transposase